MAAVNNFVTRQDADCTHTGDTNWHRGDTDLLPRIAAATLSANTKYLIVARAMLAGTLNNKEFSWRIQTADEP